MALLMLLMALIASSCAQSNGCDYGVVGYTTYYIPFASNYGNSKRLDNACDTFFILDDDDCSFIVYYSFVYCDGSNKVVSFLGTYNSSNIYIFSSPSCTFSQTLLGYVGDTVVSTRQIISGDCSDIIYPTVGANPCPNGGSASDLPQINQLLVNNGVSCSDILVLPRRLPSRCVTRQPSMDYGAIANCPEPCYDNSPSNYYPGYNYNPSSYPPNSYSPPSCSCGCSK